MKLRADSCNYKPSRVGRFLSAWARFASARRPLHGFTLVELLVVIAIIAMLLGMMMPVLGKAREKARNMICVANMKSIATSLITYTVANNDITPVPGEAPTPSAVAGKRLLPLILKDQKFLDISDKRGGVWRCPRDIRLANPHFKAYYYYWGGGPGNPADCPYEGLFMSYAANCLYRVQSDRCPWSYYAPGAVFTARKLNSVKQPGTKVMFYDSGNTWDGSADYPFQMFYNWVVLLRGTPLIYSVEPWWRHNPKSYGPTGNFAFCDGHVETNKDYLSTCGKKSVTGRWFEDKDISIRWWSVTGN